MTVLLVIALASAALVGLILALPCEVCRKRRARMEAAYAAWRDKQAGK